MTDAPFLSLPPRGLAPGQIWWLTARDGVRLRAAIWHSPEPAAHAILLSGRTEYLEKLSIPAAELVARGYSVAAVDWRGQGLSDRLATPGLKGHVRDFSDFQHDVDALLQDPFVQNLPGNRIVLCHSMGGAITAKALQRGDIAGTVSAAIFSAPMWGISMNPVMRVFACASSRFAVRLGLGNRWPPFGDVDTPYALSGDTDNSLTSDEDVWAWLGETARAYPQLSIAAPTMGWFNAARIAMAGLAKGGPLKCPSRVILGGAEEVVDAARLRRRARLLGAEVCDVPDGRHELLVEAEPLRRLTWDHIDRFLAEHGLPHGLPKEQSGSS